ncbi:hypothetical protein UlMin_036896 [Ulmus minor]
MDSTPEHFLCPISKELMKDPVTIFTGVTYERTNIEKWFFTYNKKTCPTTNVKTLDDFHITPNHTLKRLILAWQTKISDQIRNSPPPEHGEMKQILDALESSPFKMSLLKKLRLMIESDESKNDYLIGSNGVEVLVSILVQILVTDNSDFVTFRACEEAIAVLHQLPFSKDEKIFEFLSKPEAMRSMAILLQRASAEARFYTLSLLRNMARTDYDWKFVVEDQGSDLFKSLLELVSDEICTKASSCALEVLIDILDSSKKSRLKAIEAGAICVLVELLPESNRSRSEKILMLIKLLCECAEGRLALVEHGIGIGAISKKMLHVSNGATKIVVKILWLVCNFHPSERVLEEMLICGSVKKLVGLLHMHGRCSTKDKAVKILKLHGNSWKRYPCFPIVLKDYLGLK